MQMWCPSWPPRLPDEEADFSFWSSATDVCRDGTVMVRVSIIFARSAVVGADMAEGIDTAANGGERGGLGGGAAVGDVVAVERMKTRNTG
jgi:hypothetical protein